MNLLKKLTNKNLQLNKKRTIVTIIGIMLSVALITAVATMFVSLYKSIMKYETTIKGDFHISFVDVPNEDLKYFKENRYIEKYHLIEQVGYAKLEGSKNEAKPYLYIVSFTKDSLENMAVNLIEGRLPENDQEIIISNHIKTNGRVEYHVGDTLTLNVGKRVSDGYELNQSNPYGEPYKETESEEEIKEEIIDIKEHTYKIVGIIERPSNYIEDYSAPGYTCITLNDNPTGKTTVYVKFNKDGIKKPEKAIAGILDVDEKIFAMFYNGEYGEDEWEVISKEMNKAKYEIGYSNDYLLLLEGGIFKDRSFQSMGYIAGVVCLIIIITSVFCIKNSFDISISEKTKQYGVLSSIGATKKQIKKNVYYEAFKLGIVGIPLGIILGLIASSILVVICNLLLKDMLNTKMVLSISIEAIIFGILLGVITIFLSSLNSARKAARISPITAIRNSEDIKIKSKKIKSPKLIKKLFGIGGEISYKNLKRSKKKYRTTVISITVCVAVFIALSSFMHMFYDFVTVEYAAYDYNIEVLSKEAPTAKVHEEMKNIIKREDIKEYSIERTNTGSIKKPRITEDFKEIIEHDPYRYEIGYEDDESIKEYQFGEVNIVAIGDHQYRKYLKELRLDYETTKDKLILLNQVENYDAAKKEFVKHLVFDYKKGDKVNIAKFIYDEKGNSKQINTDYEIAAVSMKRPFGMSFIIGTPIMIVSDEVFDGYYTKGTEDNSEYKPDRVQVGRYLFDVENPDKFQDDIEIILKNEDVEITNIAQEQRQVKSLHLLIAIFLYGFITVIALIGITNIFNTITTNMELRKREFATLKSIGMTTKEFNRMISLESFFYGTKSLLIGIPIGIVLSILLYNLLNDDMVITKYQIPYSSIIISILVVFLLITVIMKFSINKINKQNTIETIRNENI